MSELNISIYPLHPGSHQIGKFENCVGDFKAGIKMAQIVFQF